MARTASGAVETVNERLRTAGLDPAALPRHLAVIMDGNGRWARARGQPRLVGHHKGLDAVRKLVTLCSELKIPYLTLYSFSSENWKRPLEEVEGLMGLLRHYLQLEITLLERQNIRFRVIGARERLSPDIQKLITGAEARTAGNSGLTLVLALNYGGREEIVRAVQKLATAVRDGTLAPDQITEETLSRALSTDNIPDPDIVLRTSGEQRLSNFMLWQSAYSELIFVDTLWPDFDETALISVLSTYAHRERRFGGLMVDSDRASPRLALRLRRLLRGEGLRLISAAVLVPPALLAIWLGSPWYDLMLIGAAAGMGWEWGQMTFGPGARSFGAWGMTASTAGFVLAVVFEVDALTLTGLLGIGVLSTRMLAHLSHARMPRLYTLGFPVISVSCACWFWLRGMSMGRETVFWLMGIVWATDTGAYFIGRTLGGPRLAPKISPNKTWAGLIGGMGAAAGAALLIAVFVQVASASLAFLGAGLAIVAQMGDLAESALKRHVGVKDSGKLIPGHGGILDRVDGLIPVAVVLVGLTLIFGWSLTP